ncbi:NAD(P)-binding protein [Penicillium sp. IBT 35674x]|nr:NAD(P)-binding protein [Penicillium sp. IBT 35674x]
MKVVQVLLLEYTLTGCLSYLGKSLAQAIYNAGHRIIATARDITSLSYLPDISTVLKINLDVTSKEDISTAFTKALDVFHEINVVTGYGLMGDMEAISDYDARHQLENNFWGPIKQPEKLFASFEK